MKTDKQLLDEIYKESDEVKRKKLLKEFYNN